MKKFLFCLLFLIFFLILLPKSSYAVIQKANGDVDLEAYQFEINLFNKDLGDTEDSQKIVSGKSLSVSVKAFKKDGTLDSGFFGTKNYYIQLTNPQGEGCYHESGVRGHEMGKSMSNGTNDDIWVDIADSQGAFVNKAFNNVQTECTLIAGVWKISIWQAHQIPSEGDYLFRNAGFVVRGANDGTPARMELIDDQPINKTICSNKVTQVKLLNGVKDQIYTFWWEATFRQVSIAAKSQPLDANSFRVVNLTGFGLDQANLKPKLCMAEGDVWPFLAGNACSQDGHHLEFDQPKGSPICSKTPNQKCELTGSDIGQAGQFKVVLTATGIPVGTDLSAVLAADAPVKPTSTSNGISIFDFGPQPPATYPYQVIDQNGVEFCSGSKEISSKTVANPDAPVTPLPKCEAEPLKDGKPNPNFCASGAGEACPNGGVNTAIGCVPTEPQRFIAGLMKYVMGFGGGVALLLMIFGSFQMLTSAGNPDVIKKGREQFVNAVIGLLFIIFSTLLMQILGVDILNLPGFTK